MALLLPFIELLGRIAADCFRPSKSSYENMASTPIFLDSLMATYYVVFVVVDDDFSTLDDLDFIGSFSCSC